MPLAETNKQDDKQTKKLTNKVNQTYIYIYMQSNKIDGFADIQVIK
jgi:hypothetical protein